MRHGLTASVERNCRNVALSLLIVCGATACGAADEPSSEAVSSASSPIVNGTVMNDAQVQLYGMAAVYHKAYNPDNTWFWWPRPCSGVIIRSISGISHVLTARHCITRDGTTDGVPMAAADIRISRAASPGLANPNPPASAVTAFSITPMPVTGFSSTSRDMALVRVNVDWSTSVSSRLGIFVNHPSVLAGVSMTPFGFGINVNDNNCYNNRQSTTGAGIARWGGPFTISSGAIAGQGGQYDFPNSTGKRVLCGDSGGHDVAHLGHSEYGVWGHILGVHSTGAATAQNSAASLWLQNTMPPYLSPYSDRTLSVGLAGAGGISLDLWAAPDSQVITVKYNAGTKQILDNGPRCLNHSLLWATCNNSNSQAWTLTVNQKLINVQTNLCLAHSGAFNIVTQACTTASQNISRRQMWAWHIQP